MMTLVDNYNWKAYANTICKFVFANMLMERYQCPAVLKSVQDVGINKQANQYETYYDQIMFFYDYMEMKERGLTLELRKIGTREHTRTCNNQRIDTWTNDQAIGRLFWPGLNQCTPIGSPNKIAVCTGEDNIQKYFSTTNSYNWSANIDDITPTWRNPMYGEWDLVKEDLESQGFEVVNISYRERLSDTINKLEDCSSIIGYYGVTQFLALLMNLPLISVYDNSKNDSYSRVCNRVIINDYKKPKLTATAPHDFKELIRESKKKWELGKKRYGLFKEGIQY